VNLIVCSEPRQRRRRSLAHATYVAYYERRLQLAVMLIAAVIFAQAALAVALPFTEPFDYSEGVLTSVSGGTWSSSSTGPEISVSNSAALTAPAGFPGPSGKGVKWVPGGTARRANPTAACRPTASPGSWPAAI
jgi:hypothetical protein